MKRKVIRKKSIPKKKNLAIENVLELIKDSKNKSNKDIT